jgi:hypothetical protein
VRMRVCVLVRPLCLQNLILGVATSPRGISAARRHRTLG